MTGKTPRGGNGRFTRSPDTARRDMEAAELHGQGWSYQKIADALGFASKGAACNAVKRAFASIPTEGAAEAKRLDLERLDRLIEWNWTVMQKPHVTVSQGKVVRQFAGFELRADGTEALDADGKRIPLFADVLDDGPGQASAREIRALIQERERIFGYAAPVKKQIEFVSSDSVEATITALEQQLAVNDPAD